MGFVNEQQVREEHYFTDGPVIVKGKRIRRGNRKFADFVLFYQSNFKLALIEAKDNIELTGGKSVTLATAV